MRDVLIIARHYYPLPGAATNRLEALVRALVTAGTSVTVVSRAMQADDPLVGRFGERILRVKGDKKSGRGLIRAMALFTFPFLAARVVLRNNIEADVVVTDPPPTMSWAMARLAKRLDARAVYYLADSWAELLRSSGRGLVSLIAYALARLERRALRHASGVIAVTSKLQAYALRENRNVLLAANGIDGEVFSAVSTAPEPFESPTTLPYFLYAGNFGAAHGAEIFARAVAASPNTDARYAVVYMGYGSTEHILKELSAQYPGRIFVLPPQSPEHAASAFRQAIGGLASVKDDESLSHAISVKALASVACGAPLLYVGDGDFATIVRTEGMGVAMPHDPETVARVLLEMTRNPWGPRRRADLAEMARSKYDNRTMAQDVIIPWLSCER